MTSHIVFQPCHHEVTVFLSASPAFSHIGAQTSLANVGKSYIKTKLPRPITFYLSKEWGKNHMLFHCCFIQRVEESEGSESQHMAWGIGADVLFGWGIVFLFICIRHYSSTRRRMDKRAKTCVAIVCGEDGVKSTIYRQAQSTTGNINFTCLATVGGWDHFTFPKNVQREHKTFTFHIGLELFTITEIL